jgi:uncharacterized protein (DUF1501 family)
MRPSPFPTTRREFLRGATGGIGLLAFGQFAPSFLVQSVRADSPRPEKDRSILVLVQLAGGNDGLNTVVPYTDDAYYRLRPNLGLPAASVLPLSDTQGLHPACAPLHHLFDRGQLAVVQNVGYPNPNRSHFRSTEIWEAATASDATSATGWIGRFLDNTCAGMPGQATADAAPDPVAVHISDEVPGAFLAAGNHATFGLPARSRGRSRDQGERQLLTQLVRPADHSDADHDHTHGNAGFLRQVTLDTLVTERRVQEVVNRYRPEVTYPGDPFANSLRQVAALISAGFSTRVYFVSLGGFDTHNNQAGAHERLLRTLSTGLAAFQADLTARKLDDQVLTMTFSEFGRRPNENLSAGTDHGTAAPLFALGAGVRGGLLGTPPSLDLAPNEDLSFSTDFRQVYASVLRDWLGAPPETIPGQTFAPLPLFHNRVV